MKGKRCRLYDEEIVRNIMVSTGMSVFEFLKKNRNLDVDDVCEYVDLHADGIIEDTIEDLNDRIEEPPGGALPPSPDDTATFPPP